MTIWALNHWGPKDERPGRDRFAIVPEELTNTELAERAYDAWNADDLEAMLTFCHPEAAFIPSGVFPGMESDYRGEQGVRRW